MPRTHPTGVSRPARAPLPTTATSGQRVASNAATLRATTRHFHTSKSSMPVTFALGPIIPPPAPLNIEVPLINLATARTILFGPVPSPSADSNASAIAATHRRQAQSLVDSVDVSTTVILCPHTGNIFLPTPGSCAVILHFTLSNSPKSESALQTIMVRLSSECGLSCPRFVTVDSLFPSAFLLFCHSEDNPLILTLLFLLLSLLNGVRVLTDEIVSLAKLRVDSNDDNFFGSALVGALRRTQALAHCIGAIFVAP